MSSSIIFVGPKKTGTTAVYQYIRQRITNQSCFHLFLKETNRLVDLSMSALELTTPNPFIDVSPEYFTSWRALVKAKKLVQLGHKITVVVLMRDVVSRGESHLNYMFAKKQLSNDFNEPEWECLFRSKLNIWKENWEGDYIELNLADVPEFLNLHFNLCLGDLPRSNEGGVIFRNSQFGKLASTSAAYIKRFPGGYFMVEMLTPLLRKLLYKKGLPNEEPDEFFVREFKK